MTGETITVVSGLPRSGTSMMMKMLEAGGIAPLTDDLREADTDNPKGYYEWERVKKLPEGDTAWLDDARGKAVKVISALLKELPAGYEYRIIFMERAMAEVLASQRKMLQHRGTEQDAAEDETMARLFQKHLDVIRSWLESQPNMSVLYVSYNDVLADAAPQIERIDEFLGGGLDVEAMTGVVDSRLYRRRAVPPQQ